MSETLKRIERLIEKAANADSAPNAMQFAQAALSAAHATRTMCEAIHLYPAAFMEKASPSAQDVLTELTTSAESLLERSKNNSVQTTET